MKKISIILVLLSLFLCINVSALENKTRMLDRNYLVTMGNKTSYNSTTLTGTINGINFYNDGRTFSGTSVDVSIKGDNSVLLYTVGNTYNIVANGDIILPYDSSYLFAILKDSTINFNNSIDTSYVTNMSHMFDSFCYNITTCNIDTTSFDTKNVTDMSNMFLNTGYNSTTLNVDVTGYNTKNVTTMASMFSKMGYKATSFSLTGINNFNTSNVEDMSGMFQYLVTNGFSGDLIFDLSKWNTSKVTNMSHMFSYSGRKSLNYNIGDLSKWDTSKVTDMNEMFRNTGKKLILDLRYWDTSMVTSYNKMFYQSNADEIYINNFKIDATDDITNMLSSTYYLQILGVGSNNIEKVKTVLQEPNNSYLTGVTGKWYDGNKNSYTVSEMPLNEAYFYAYEPNIIKFMNNTDVIGIIVKPFNKDIKLNIDIPSSSYNVTTKLYDYKDIISKVSVTKIIDTLDQGYSINDIYSTNDDLVLNATIKETRAGELITLDTPVREGYKFNGWSLSENGDVIKEHKPIEDSILYPIWEENNPNTGDGIVLYMVIGGIFAVIILVLVLIVKGDR